MTIEFLDGRRSPVLIDYEYALSDEELLTELWVGRIKKLVLLMNTSGLLCRLRIFSRRRSLTSNRN